MKQTINTVYQTDDLGQFQQLEGNRAVLEARVQKITRSIQRVGFIQAPIIVNEKMEVVDGQGRLEACRRLGLPVPYVIVQGIGLKECQSMNAEQTNWTTLDYINSFVDAGNENYTRFLQVIEEHSDVTLGITTWCVFRSVLSNVHDSIRAGEITVTEEQVARANEELVFWSNFKALPFYRSTRLFMAVMIARGMKDVDDDRLLSVLQNTDPKKFVHIHSLFDALDALQEAYNFRKRGKTVWIRHNYEVALENDGSSIGRLTIMRNRQKARTGESV